MAEQPATIIQPTEHPAGIDSGVQLTVLEGGQNGEGEVAGVERTPGSHRLFRPPGHQEAQQSEEPSSTPDVAPPRPRTRLFRPASHPESSAGQGTPSGVSVERTPGGRRIFRPSEHQRAPLDEPSGPPEEESSRPQVRLFRPPEHQEVQQSEEPSSTPDVVPPRPRTRLFRPANHPESSAGQGASTGVSVERTPGGRRIFRPAKPQEPRQNTTKTDSSDRGKVVHLPIAPDRSGEDHEVSGYGFDYGMPAGQDDTHIIGQTEISLPGGHTVTVANEEPGAESYVTSWVGPDDQEVKQLPRRHREIRGDIGDATLVAGNYDNTEAPGRLPAPVLSSNKDFIAWYNRQYPAPLYDKVHPSPEGQHPYNIHRNGWLRAEAMHAAKGLAAKARKVFDGAVGAVGLDKMVDRAYGSDKVEPEAEAPANDNTTDSPEARAELEEVTFYRKLNKQIADDDIPAAIESAQRLLDTNGRKPGTVRLVANAFLNKSKGYRPSPQALKYVTSLASDDIDASPEDSLGVRNELLETLEHFREPDIAPEKAAESSPSEHQTADDSEDVRLLSAVG